MAAKKKMLIADDERVLHGFYGELFAEEFEIIDAYDGGEALELARKHLPEVMILDVSMPRLDGRTLCKALKESPGTRRIKVIMVTAKVEHSDRIVGFEVGADDYIEKPACPEYLRRAVRNAMHRP